MVLVFFSVNFPNADVIHDRGSTHVVCHEFYRFSDGTTNKEYTDEDRLLQYQQGCTPPGKL